MKTTYWLQVGKLYRLQTSNPKAIQLMERLSIGELAGDGVKCNGEPVRIYTIAEKCLASVIGSFESNGIEIQKV